MAGSSTAEPLHPAFYLDLASPESYLAAERVLQALPVTAEWMPVLARDLPGAESWEAFRCADERDIAMGRIETLAAERGLQPVRWPDPFPFDSAFAMRVATYAKQIGRTVAFVQAAFRQAFAGGRDLSLADNVLIAASACEMHPASVLKGAELRSIGTRLAAATALAVERGVRDVPAVWLPTGEVFHGDVGIDQAAAAVAELAR
jgi:2-hydroxychromene-2-carboxylate isomerase